MIYILYWWSNRMITTCPDDPGSNPLCADLFLFISFQQPIFKKVPLLRWNYWYSLTIKLDVKLGLRQAFLNTAAHLGISILHWVLNYNSKFWRKRIGLSEGSNPCPPSLEVTPLATRPPPPPRPKYWAKEFFRVKHCFIFMKPCFP